MKRVQASSVGLVFAAFLATWHAFWVLLVAFGAAQPVMDWIFRLHMIEPVYRISGFNPLTAGELILVTAAIGYIGGFVAGTIWNGLTPENRPVSLGDRRSA
jgi:hypothetical protein